MPEYVAGADAGQGRAAGYITGFLLAIFLTIVAFGAVMLRVVPATAIGPVILGAAFLQILVHLVFFLHLSSASTPRWNLAVLAFAVLVVVILVSGSVWIMTEANHNMMPAQMSMP